MSRVSSISARTPSRPNRSAESPSATILVVDTSAWVREMLTALLGRLGYRIATAATGAEALTAVAQQRPAAVMVDIRLPDMSVGELARAIRRSANLPILLMTGGDDELNAQALARVPAALTLTKPFGIAEVRDGLRACVAPPPASTHAAGSEGGAADAPAFAPARQGAPSNVLSLGLTAGMVGAALRARSAGRRDAGALALAARSC